MTSRETEVLNKVKAAPYYTVRFQPARPMDLPLERALELMQENTVRFRGWDFPHYDRNNVLRDMRYIGIQVDWAQHVELWRMYRSGQFVYFGAPWDLAMDFQVRLRKEFDQNVFIAHKDQREKIVGLFSFVGMIYTITEFYVFAARLAKSLETPNVVFETSLKNMENWALVSSEVGVPWHSFYTCQTSNIVTKADYDRLISDPVADAANALKEIFSCFGWDNSAGAVKSWQDRLMAERFVF